MKTLNPGEGTFWTVSGKFLIATVFIFISLSAEVRAQSCDNIAQGGGQSILASAAIDGTTLALPEGGFVAPYTRLRLDSYATPTVRVLEWVGTAKQVPVFVRELAIPILARSITPTFQSTFLQQA